MSAPTVREYWELAEMTHPGPMRQYAEELRAYLAEVEALVGMDEYVCEVCGVRNVSPTGTDRRFFLTHEDRHFCEAHVREFKQTFP